MKYGLGDTVRIISRDQVGYICDGPNVHPQTGEEWYIIDAHSFVDSDEIEDCVLDAAADDLELLERA